MTISYDITWDLDPAAPTFRGRTSVRFKGTRAYAELSAVSLREALLNGWHVPWDGARLALDVDGVLEVDADFAYHRDRGFRRVEVDGATYLYALHYPDSAGWTFPCVDQTTRSRVNLTVDAPGVVLTNSTAAPIPPYTITAAVGPWVEVGEGVHVMRSRAGERDRGRVVSRLIEDSVAFFESVLGVPYPYEKCDAVFVPEFPHLAFSSPGLIMFDDAVFDALATREPKYAATVLSHEVAHAWSGNLVNAEPWLVEALATYLSRLATEQFVPGVDPWAIPENTPWPDRPYVPHLAHVRAVEDTMGRETLLSGLSTFLSRYAHTNAGWAELKACLSE
ncbi:M1 family aminopeptidase [Saccharothrix obliqua]|uniref:M1 family aminopeptidase n=1 Tax=Saccharothrix obliqua TaxID=2861747 RepID=UPI001C5D5049|nr:M1 family aminopeptidase [Saccharothrix obliqua]MBW4719197.1 aminopeptidase [Saccharothrix obliqua]